MTTSKVVLFHPGTPPFAQQAARALHEAGLLARYVTGFAYRPHSRLSRALRIALRPLWADPARELARRQVAEVPDEAITTYPLPEMLRMAVNKLRLGRIAEDLVWERSEHWFDRVVARHFTGDAGAVYGYEHAALATFTTVKARGGLCVYDMPACHHRTAWKLLRPEYEAFPEVDNPYDRHGRLLAPCRDARRDAELALADLVVVPSTFVKGSLTSVGVSEERIAVVPFGSPPVAEGPPHSPYEPLIFLSAGSQSVRKGTHYLLEAWRRLRPGPGVELWMIGRMQLPERLLRDLPGTVVIRPGVPRGELFAIYRRAGALVLPTLSEGFALVITEAMANGLPVITTPNSGGVDVIRDGENGMIVPIRDVDRLAEAMAWCIDHHAELRQMSHAAHATAAAWQWPQYRVQLAQAVGELCRNVSVC